VQPARHISGWRQPAIGCHHIGRDFDTIEPNEALVQGLAVLRQLGLSDDADTVNRTAAPSRSAIRSALRAAV